MESADAFEQPVTTPMGSPLRQLSSDQMNQKRLPQSPSLPNISIENERPNYHRSRESISSDVRSKVDFFNGSNPSSPTKPVRPFALPQTPTHGALQRAILGFEESQASLASAKAENERLVEQLKSAKHREKLISERIESLIDQLSTERESRNNDKKHYVAEVKKCRKQAYQADLHQLETQESLKEVKQELRRAQAELAAERTKKEEARQEAFERAYAVSGLTEELEMLKSNIKMVEKERDAARMELRTTPAPEVAIILTEEKAVQVSLEIPVQHIGSDLATQQQNHSEQQSTTTQQITNAPGQNVSRAKMPFYSDFVARDQVLRDLHDEPFTYEDHVQALYEEVRTTREELRRQLDQIEFMHLECQSGSCACKQAEKRGERYIYDQAFEDFRQERSRKKRKLEQRREARPLPPPPAQFERLEMPIEAAEVVEAVQIPLPSPLEREFTSKDPSPEPTAVLEELTQVMVEQGKDSAPFTFSMSTSSYAHSQPQPSTINNDQTAEAIEVDMFDISQARHHPPRPSTAMGILTIQSPERSPIRLVPESPDVRSLPPASATRDDGYHTYTSQTTRVALKGSPQRTTHQRSQSRPNIRSHSRTRSPLHMSESTHTPAFDKASSASPAASTIFPVTPIVKHHHRIEAQQTITTTTTIPLRDTEDDYHHHQQAHSGIPSTPASLSHTHAHSHTQPISLSQESAPSSSHAQMLANITGTPVSRDAALAQIRARRDRARSLNMKKMGGSGSSEGGGTKTPGSARRGIMLRDGVVGGAAARERGGGEGMRERDVSVASVQTAPGRF